MDDCCEAKTEELSALRRQHGRVLGVVLGVNAFMFFVEFAAGLLADSSALLADSLDMLGDSLVYGFSLFVVHRGAVWKARAAFSKGAIMLIFGVAVLVEVGWKIYSGASPEVHTMALVGLVALLANGLCFLLLWRHRADDINLRSTWLCSRNDLVANTAVLAAAWAVAWSGSGWPDILVGLGIALLFLRTAFGVIREALLELGRADGHPG